jgi:beta-xylosidase
MTYRIEKQHKKTRPSQRTSLIVTRGTTSIEQHFAAQLLSRGRSSINRSSLLTVRFRPVSFRWRSQVGSTCDTSTGFHSPGSLLDYAFIY